jgi:hypothetical protein
MIGKPISAVLAIAFAAALAGGCASDGGFATGSVQPISNAEARVDPACVTLVSQIDTIRKEGTIERLEKASTGTGAVQVKRTALQKQAELNKLNADYQAKCGTTTPAAKPVTAGATPAPAVAPATPPAAAPAAPAAAKVAKTAAAGSGLAQVAPGIAIAKKAVAPAAPAAAAEVEKKAE